MSKFYEVKQSCASLFLLSKNNNNLSFLFLAFFYFYYAKTIPIMVTLKVTIIGSCIFSTRKDKETNHDNDIDQLPTLKASIKKPNIIPIFK